MNLLPENLAAQALALYLADGDDAVLAIQSLYAPVSEVITLMADAEEYDSSEETIQA